MPWQDPAYGKIQNFKQMELPYHGQIKDMEKKDH